MFVPPRLFIVVNVVFVVFHPQQAISERERARWREVVPIVWRISFSRRRGRVARGKPQGFLPPLRRAGGRVSDWCRRGCKSRGYKQTFCCSLGREACRPAPWVSRPACRHPALRRYPWSPPPVVAVLKEAVRVRSEVSFTVRGFCVLPSLHLSKAKPVFGVARTVCVLPSSKVLPPETLPLALVGRTDRQRAFLRLRRAARVGGASRAGGVPIRVDGRGDIHVGLALLDGLEDGRLEPIAWPRG